MRKFTIFAISALAITAMSAGVASAARGDNSEGNGGGTVFNPEFYHLAVSTSSVDNPSREWTEVKQYNTPAGLSCTGRDTKGYDDFTRACTYTPAKSWTETVVHNQGQPASIITTSCPQEGSDAGVMEPNVTTYFNKKKQLKKNSSPTTMCRYKFVKYNNPDRGNSGNR